MGNFLKSSATLKKSHKTLKKKIIKHSRLTKVQNYKYADRAEEQIVREIL